MVEFALDENDRGSIASSENEQDELMEDADDMEADMNGDEGGDEEDEDHGEDNGDDDQEEDEEDDQPFSQVRRSNTDSDHGTPTHSNGNGTTSHPHPTLIRTSASPAQTSASFSPKLRLEVRAEALTASSYDIVPTIAAPQSTSINAIAATPDMRYWFSGGSDCYIRKYDGVASINGKTQLTVAQRHPYVDSVVKAGVLMSYWDNEESVAKNPGDEPPLSPVYSLAVQSEALWMLSGLESGCINLYSVRHDEGKRITCLQKHTSAVSVLTLTSDEQSVLSGSWDKNIYDWDLNSGQIRRSFHGSGGQISAIEIRPASSLPVPEELGEVRGSSGTLTGNGDKPVTNGVLTNGMHPTTNGTGADEGNEDAPGDTDSLFDDATDSLFGETDGVGAPSGGNFADDEDEFSKALEVGHHDQNHEDQPADVVMEDEDTTLGPDATLPTSSSDTEQTNGPQSSVTMTASSVAKAEHMELSSTISAPETQDAIATSDSTFLAASIDGSIRVWDRRQPNPVARILTRTGVPPWCMAACWSPDGNFIYAGRRNGTVEEFSLHKGLRSPERTVRFPLGSNAVTALRTMPNGRHLICASFDILRLYDLKQKETNKHSTVPFLIVPGPPRAGVVSALYLDPTCTYMLSAAGNRGWEGTNTESLIGYEIGCVP